MIIFKIKNKFLMNGFKLQKKINNLYKEIIQIIINFEKKYKIQIVSPVQNMTIYLVLNHFICSIYFLIKILLMNYVNKPIYIRSNKKIIMTPILNKSQ